MLENAAAQSELDGAEAKRRKMLEAVGGLDADDDDDDDDDEADEDESARDKGKGKAVESESATANGGDDDDDDDSDSDDDEDETAELLRELEKIKKERAEEKEKLVSRPERPLHAASSFADPLHHEKERERMESEQTNREEEIAMGK